MNVVSILIAIQDAHHILCKVVSVLKEGLPRPRGLSTQPALVCLAACPTCLPTHDGLQVLHSHTLAPSSAVFSAVVDNTP